MNFFNLKLLKNSHKLIFINQKSLRNFSINQSVDISYASYENRNEHNYPLIVLHGLFGSKSNWNSLCKVLNKRTQRKIIAIDHRNHGDSPHVNEHTYEHCINDLKRLLERLNIDKCSLMGHSMGGRTSMLFTLKNPEFIEKLIVVDISPVRTSPNLSTLPNLFKILLTLKLPTDVTLVKARQLMDQQLKQTINDQNLRAFLLTNLIDRNNGEFTWRINIKTLLDNFNEIASFPDINQLTFNGPTLFIGGQLSDYIKNDDHMRILQIFPNTQFQYIENAGHWVHSEKPQEFLNITVDFLNTKINK